MARAGKLIRLLSSFSFRKLAVSLRILVMSPPKLLRRDGMPLPRCFFPDRKEGDGHRLLLPLIDLFSDGVGAMGVDSDDRCTVSATTTFLSDSSSTSACATTTSSPSSSSPSSSRLSISFNDAVESSADEVSVRSFIEEVVVVVFDSTNNNDVSSPSCSSTNFDKSLSSSSSSSPPLSNTSLFIR